MDEEQPKKKITLNNFFESIQSADSKADRALRKNTSNLDLIDKNKSLIEGLIKSLKDIKSEVELNSLESSKSMKIPFKRTVSRLHELTSQSFN